MASAITLDRVLAVQAAYIRCIDTSALEAWPDFFLDDCLYIVTTAENHKNGFESGIIYADTKGMLIDRVAALRQANIYEKQSYRHILGLPYILKKRRRRGGMRNAVHGDAHHARRPDADVFATGSISTPIGRWKRAEIRQRRRRVRFVARRHPDGAAAVMKQCNGRASLSPGGGGSASEASRGGVSLDRRDSPHPAISLTFDGDPPPPGRVKRIRGDDVPGDSRQLRVPLPLRAERGCA